MRSTIHLCVEAPFRQSRCVQHHRGSKFLAQSRFARSNSSSSKQTHTIDDFTADLLDAPLRTVQPATRTAPTPPPVDQPPRTEREEQIAKARVVFGSRLAGPVERRKAIEVASQVIAGVTVPPKPEEPDNCCMSGCVNCVWDLFRDEFEEWAEKSGEAKMKLAQQKAQEFGSITSMDEDGGGSESNWVSGTDLKPGQDLFADIPVGIREFMKTEKLLKQTHTKAVLATITTKSWDHLQDQRILNCKAVIAPARLTSCN
nr:upf0651 protein, mitochondrial [Quercus suber]